MDAELEPSGSSMSERQSYEVVIDGLKLAADGAKHLALLCQDIRWTRVGWALDATRKAIADRAQLGKSIDGEISVNGVSASAMSITSAFTRHIEGLRMANGGLRQMAVYHRKQMFWLKWAKQVDLMQTKAGALLKRSSAPLTWLQPLGGTH